MFSQHSFLTVLDAKRVPKREHLGAKIASKIDFFVFFVFLLIFLRFFNDFWLSEGQELLSERYLLHLVFCSFFCSVLDGILVPFGLPKWSQVGAKIEQKKHQKKDAKNDRK